MRKNLPPSIKGDLLKDRREVYERLSWISEEDQEFFVVVTLDPCYRLIGEHTISIGGHYINHVPVNVLLERVVCDKARYFFVAHNHPNGFGEPSENDYKLLLKLLFLCEFMEIDLVDSLIFPYQKKPSSMRSRHPRPWQTWYVPIFEEATNNLIPKKVQPND